MAAVASLGLLFAACDDNNGGSDMSADMAVKTDFAMNNGDMTATPDLNPGPGTAQLTIADVEGTYPAGAATPAAPFSHLLFTTQSIPEQAGATHQKDNRMPGPGALSGFLFGCTADYYDGATSLPPSAANAGKISYSGYNTQLGWADATGMGAGVPASINCDFASLNGLGVYECAFGMLGQDGGMGSADGADPATVLFPPMQCPATPPAVNNNCAGVAHNTCPAGFVPHVVATTPITVYACEQQPTVVDPVTPANTTKITEMLAGNGTYSAAINKMVTVAKSVTVLTVDSTGTPAAPANPADPLAGITLDGSHDVTITWNCSGDTSKPAGDGCSPTSFTGLIVLSSPTQALPMGVAQCVMPSKNPAGSPGTITLPKDFIKTILGGSTSGPALALLAQLNGNPNFSGSHEVVLTAGQGYFAFLPK
ncbi:MAG: hypothetical protein ACHQ17_00285 [Polyangia bacterium]|jgi:hypothetical protein